MGIPQQFAHTRFYTDIDFSFYIDEDYTLLKIFEGWMEYIYQVVQIVLQDKMTKLIIEECNIQTHTNVITCLLINLKKIIREP